MEHAVVLGLGSSGEAAALLLRRLEVDVTVLDAKGGPALEARAAGLRQAGCTVLTGASAVPDAPYELAVLSPGIAITDHWVVSLKTRGVPVVSELELGWRACRSKILAVTGSNGKSTLVKFCREALRRSGLTAEAGGNYGIPLSALALQDPAPDWIVAEVSSFQLEAVDGFAPEVGILLNLNPNHLDRHGTLDVYTAMKARLFARMTAGQTAVVAADAATGIQAGIPPAARRLTFGAGPAADFRYEPGRIVGPAGSVPLSGTPFDNEIMGTSAAACAAAMAAAGVPLHGVAEAARDFERLPHRMQTVARIRGVTFVNDSKATNLAALAAGVLMAGGPVRLIAGGLLKESDLEPVKIILAKRVRAVYIIGKYSHVMASAWSDVVACTECASLEEAVGRAWKESCDGEVVLLSPGCASFDQFSGFEDRGEKFSGFVRDIQKGDRA